MALVPRPKPKYPLPDNFRFKEARECFKGIDVVDCEKTDVSQQKVDYEALKKFLVEENNFNAERIDKSLARLKAARQKSTQKRIDSFFTVGKVYFNRRLFMGQREEEA